MKPPRRRACSARSRDLLGEEVGGPGRPSPFSARDARARRRAGRTTEDPGGPGQLGSAPPRTAGTALPDPRRNGRRGLSFHGPGRARATSSARRVLPMPASPAIKKSLGSSFEVSLTACSSESISAFRPQNRRASPVVNRVGAGTSHRRLSNEGPSRVVTPVVTTSCPVSRAGSCSRTARSSLCSSGLGKMPSCSASRMRRSWYVRSASTWRPLR